jgi:hypothetical protein
MMSFVVAGTTLLADRSKQEISMNIRMEHVSGEFWLATLAVLNRDERDNEVVRAEFQVRQMAKVELLVLSWNQ